MAQDRFTIALEHEVTERLDQEAERGKKTRLDHIRDILDNHFNLPDLIKKLEIERDRYALQVKEKDTLITALQGDVRDLSGDLKAARAVIDEMRSGREDYHKIIESHNRTMEVIFQRQGDIFEKATQRLLPAPEQKVIRMTPEDTMQESTGPHLIAPDQHPAGANRTEQEPETKGTLFSRIFKKI